MLIVGRLPSPLIGLTNVATKLLRLAQPSQRRRIRRQKVQPSYVHDNVPGNSSRPERRQPAPGCGRVRLSEPPFPGRTGARGGCPEARRGATVTQPPVAGAQQARVSLPALAQSPPGRSGQAAEGLERREELARRTCP